MGVPLAACGPADFAAIAANFVLSLRVGADQSAVRGISMPSFSSDMAYQEKAEKPFRPPLDCVGEEDSAV